ncbi:MAG TPA: acetyl-CoA carboxylase carboxyltransferase subunit alpha [Armatimonadota bacterium]|nr:acetyl-CoA carboxylase carboxyltransferase subunit alpha [Armatimonadota bacterium]
MRTVLSFEQPIHDIERQIETLRNLQAEGGPDVSVQIAKAEDDLRRVQTGIYSNLTPWDKVQMARHQDRPHTLEYIAGLAGDSFVELHGDRRFGDDPAIVGGLASIFGRSVIVFGHQKARDLKGRQFRNFGSARPEGYRKAIRLMNLAEKLRLPVVSLIDTSAADCSVGSEARGISEAIASSMYRMAGLTVPVVVIVTGEGGSGGAIGIGVGNHIMMLEHAVYSVIPPEGCAAILWKDDSQGDRAAVALQLTAEDSVRLGVVDEIIREPLGGAHREPAQVISEVGRALDAALDRLSALSPQQLLDHRYEKFRRMGVYDE